MSVDFVFVQNPLASIRNSLKHHQTSILLDDHQRQRFDVDAEDHLLLIRVRELTFESSASTLLINKVDYETFGVDLLSMLKFNFLVGIVITVYNVFH